MQTKTLMAATATALLFATAAFANIVNINTVSGIWSAADPVGTTNLAGIGTSSIHWGTPVTAGQFSGYDFVGDAPQANVASPFNVGTFTHNNFPIFANPAPGSITSATLDVVVTGDVDGTGFSLASQFVFSHDETSNAQASCPAQPVPCDDIVTLVSASFGSDTINVGGQDVIFNIIGFTSGLSFATTEGQANSTNLIGEFTTRPAPIPLPAAGWMLLAGLGGLAAMRRRKNAA